MNTDRVILKQCPHAPYDAIAFMPDAPANPGFILSYEHVGQHGEASYSFYRDCAPLSPRTEKGARLLRELRSIGYKPRLVKRLQRNCRS